MVGLTASKGILTPPNLCKLTLLPTGVGPLLPPCLRGSSHGWFPVRHGAPIFHRIFRGWAGREPMMGPPAARRFPHLLATRGRS